MKIEGDAYDFVGCVLSCVISNDVASNDVRLCQGDRFMRLKSISAFMITDHEN